MIPTPPPPCAKTPFLVILDFDGTLADTWPWFAEEVVRGAETLRYRPVTRAEVETLRELPTREIFRALDLPLWRLPSLARHMRRRAEAAAGGMRLFPGMAELIEALHGAGATIAVASSNSERTVRQVLGEDLAGRVRHYACRAAVFGKAATFRRLLRRAGAEPGRTVAVGDETRDLEAAEAAGIGGIAVEWGFARAELLRRAAPGRTAASVEALRATLLAEARG